MTDTISFESISTQNIPLGLCIYFVNWLFLIIGFQTKPKKVNRKVHWKLILNPNTLTKFSLETEWTEENFFLNACIDWGGDGLQSEKQKQIDWHRKNRKYYIHTHKLNSLKFQEITDTWLDPKHNKYSVTEHYCMAISLSLIKKNRWVATDLFDDVTIHTCICVKLLFY